MKKESILNPNKTKKSNIVQIIIGVVISVGTSLLYAYNYNKINFFDLSKFETEFVCLCLAVFVFFIGAVLLISAFNFNNRIIPSILLMGLGGLLISIIRDEPIRVAFFILVGSFFVFALTKIFYNVSSTIFTFSVNQLLTVFILGLFAEITPNMNASLAVYLSFTISLVFYIIFGVKMNRLCLKHLFGSYALEEYDAEKLRNHINFIYLILFIILNIFFMYSNEQEETLLANSINNALITGVCITNVVWRKLQ